MSPRSLVVAFAACCALAAQDPAKATFVTEGGQTVLSVRRPPGRADSRAWVLCDANGQLAIANGETVPLLDAQGRALPGSEPLVALRLMPADKLVSAPRSGLRFSRHPERRSCVLLDHQEDVVELGLGDEPLYVTELPAELAGTSPPPSPTTQGPDAATTARIERDALENPATLNKAIELLLDEPSRALLAGIDFQFKAFEGDDGETALGFGYDWARSWSGVSPGDGPDLRGGSLDLRARGNVAFDEEVNPSDFLDTHLTGRWFASHGGYQGKALTDTEFANAMKALDDEWSAGWGSDEEWERALRSPRFQERVRKLRQGLGTQVHWDVGIDGGFETNQRFTARNLTGGLVARLDVKAWDPDSWLAKANLLDWPFAALRFLTGYDKSFELRGSTLPTLLVAVEEVFPLADDPRTLLGDDSEYLRLRGELTFRTPIGLVGERQLFFNADLRWFHEIDAGAVVRAVELDSYHYVALSVSSAEGFFVTYKSGHLPFAIADQDVFELGVQFHF